MQLNRPGLGRVFAPSGDRAYAFASSPGRPFLVIDRQTGAASIEAATRLDSVIGPPTARAKSIRVDAIVGLLTFPDDRYLVVVTETATKAVACETGQTHVPYVTKISFLALKPSSANDAASPEVSATALAAADAESSAAALSAKQRSYLKDFLEAGDVYLAIDERAAFTHTLQRRAARRGELPNGPLSAPPSLADADARFVWNLRALAPLAEAGPGPWLTPLIQAAIFTEQVVLPGGGVLVASVVARRSCEHAGTRFKTRGLNDGGAAANFVEIEQILHMRAKKAAATALVQVRGSVPLFWEQRGKLGTINPKPRVSRVAELTVPTLRQHLAGLAALYGPVLLLSLLEQKGDEAELAQHLARCLELLEHAEHAEPLQPPIGFAPFDFHAASKASSRADACRSLLQKLATEHTTSHPAAHGYFAMRDDPPPMPTAGGPPPPPPPPPPPVSTQAGIVRTNCLDCLNRTNMAQTVLGLQSASAQLRALCTACELPAAAASAALETTLQASALPSSSALGLFPTPPPGLPLLTLPWPPLSLPLRTRGATPCRPHCGSCGSRQETSSRSSTRAPPTSPR